MNIDDGCYGFFREWLAITAITINHDSHGQHDALATSTIVRLLRF